MEITIFSSCCFLSVILEYDVTWKIVFEACAEISGLDIPNRATISDKENSADSVF